MNIVLEGSDSSKNRAVLQILQKVQRRTIYRL